MADSDTRGGRALAYTAFGAVGLVAIIGVLGALANDSRKQRALVPTQAEQQVVVPPRIGGPTTSTTAPVGARRRPRVDGSPSRLGDHLVQPCRRSVGRAWRPAKLSGRTGH